MSQCRECESYSRLVTSFHTARSNEGLIRWFQRHDRRRTLLGNWLMPFIDHSAEDFDLIQRYPSKLIARRLKFDLEFFDERRQPCLLSAFVLCV